MKSNEPRTALRKNVENDFSQQTAEHGGAFPIARFADAEIAPNAPAHIEGIIFDLDGTLIDSMPYWENLGENYLIKRGKTPAADIRKHFKRMTLEESAVFLREDYGLEESVEEICDGILDGVLDAYRDAIPLKPGAAAMLKALDEAGVRMCIATATERQCAVPALERLGAMRYFSEVFTCSEIGAGKTEPLIFETALERLGTAREATYVFEDSLHAIETAKTAGFPVAAVHEPSSSFEAAGIRGHADVYLHSFRLRD